MEKIFKDILGAENVFCAEAMKNHTTFHIGGVADYFLEITDEETLLKILRLCKDEKMLVFVLGNGSNILVGDKGIRGAVLHFKKNFCSVEVEGNIIKAECGALLSRLSKVAEENSLSGFEGIGGIPGTLGGAVYMNAGAYGYEISSCLKKIRYVDEELNIKEVEKKDGDFSYRKSPFTDSNKIVLSAEFELSFGDSGEIKEKTAEYNLRRREKQPLEKFSAGSTFKRPEGYFAGALIEEAGLKGLSVGDAEVSLKHAGFIVNNKNASATQVLELIELVKKRVYEKFNVWLEAEVKTVGEFEDRG